MLGRLVNNATVGRVLERLEFITETIEERRAFLQGQGRGVDGVTISRTWHGAVPLEAGDGFAAYLDETGVKDTLAISGCQDARVRRIDQDRYAHFFLMTLWDSWEAIGAYAGDEPEIAVTYPDDARYGLISDPIVIHQEVLATIPTEEDRLSAKTEA